MKKIFFIYLNIYFKNIDTLILIIFNLFIYLFIHLLIFNWQQLGEMKYFFNTPHAFKKIWRNATWRNAHSLL